MAILLLLSLFYAYRYTEQGGYYAKDGHLRQPLYKGNGRLCENIQLHIINEDVVEEGKPCKRVEQIFCGDNAENGKVIYRKDGYIHDDAEYGLYPAIKGERSRYKEYYKHEHG